MYDQFFAEQFSAFSTRAASSLLTSSTQCPCFPSAAQRVKDIPAGAIPYVSLEDIIVFKVWLCHHLGTESEARGAADAAFKLLGTVPQPLALTQEQQDVVAGGFSRAINFAPRHRRDWFRKRLGLKPLKPTNHGNGQEDGREDGQESSPEGIEEGSQGGGQVDAQEDGREDGREDGQEDGQDAIREAGETNNEDEAEGGDGDGDGTGLINSYFFFCLFLFGYALLRVEIGRGSMTGAGR